MPRAIKRGDREPPLRIDIADDEEQANLNDVDSWRLILKRTDSDAVVYTSTAGEVTVTVDATDNWKAVVEHALTSADTAGPLVRVFVEVEATWPSGGTQTFPSRSFEYYDIVETHDPT